MFIKNIVGVFHFRLRLQVTEQTGNNTKEKLDNRIENACQRKKVLTNKNFPTPFLLLTH